MWQQRQQNWRTHSYRFTVHAELSTVCFYKLTENEQEERRWIDKKNCIDTIQKPLEVKFSPNKFNSRTKSSNLLKHVPSVQFFETKTTNSLVDVSMNGIIAHRTQRVKYNRWQAHNPHKHCGGGVEKRRLSVEFLIAFHGICLDPKIIENLKNTFSLPPSSTLLPSGCYVFAEVRLIIHEIVSWCAFCQFNVSTLKWQLTIKFDSVEDSNHLPLSELTELPSKGNNFTGTCQIVISKTNPNRNQHDVSQNENSKKAIENVYALIRI